MLSVTLIEVPAWGSLNLVEAVWCLAGFVAMGFSASHLRPLYQDWVVARGAHQEVLRLVAEGYLRREVIRFLQGSCLTVIGVYSAFQGSVLGNYVSVVGLVLTAVLLVMGALISVQSIWDWRTRGHVKDHIDRGE